MKYIRPAWHIGRLSRILRGQDGAVWQPLLLGIPILVSALALIGASAYNQTSEPDSDSDGMTNAYAAYAQFFGLNSTNLAADAYMDFDDDNLNGWQEFSKLTDPLAPDTDRDMISDDLDPIISRYYIQWGAPQFTTGDQYDYAHPDWVLSAYKNENGGEWVIMPDETATNMPAAYRSAWYVSATNPPGEGSLSIDLDRTILTNNLRYAIHYMVASNTDASNMVDASLFVDLLDTNGSVLAKDLYGNLMGKTNGEALVLLDVPTAEYTNAAVIHLRRGTGEVMVFEGLVYIDEDGDGLDAETERFLGTSDYSVDTDGDGISDYDEVFIYHTDPSKSDKEDDEDQDKDKKTGIIYVDQSIGSDTFTGRAPLPTAPKVVTGKDGPKKTVHKGMAAVDEDGAHTLVIKSGAYNENLDIRGKNIKVVIEGSVRL